ncbi:RNA-binding domain-containing protein [Granulicella aggregans]|uniref:RNA-binding domain-containing protein n=1 Tax=Granulicella aggregans TaxID=474949 RepID=UPI0021E068DB|nr:RNA-binding domain-containing protein [Granulicella aggregans]
MDIEEISRRLIDIEDSQTERKESISDLDRIREAICAFANDIDSSRRTGLVFVGIRDNGSCAGIEVTDDLIKRLAQLRLDGKIQPIPTISINATEVDGCRFVVIEVPPSDIPPVRVNGVCWIRTGSSRTRATPQDERVLIERRRSLHPSFDAEPLTGSTVSDLDLTRFTQEYLPGAVSLATRRENGRSIEHQLSSLRLAAPDGIPTVAGMLLLGLDLRFWIAGAYIQFIRVQGESLTTPILDQREFSGSVLDQLREIETLISLHNTRSLSLANETHAQDEEYPIEALRQLVRNGVLHRRYDGGNAPLRVTWFSNRVEIISPGGAFGIPPERFGEPGYTSYRNPVLAEGLKAFGFVERFGFGIQIAKETLQQNGHPPLELRFEGDFAFVCVRRRR